MVVPNLMEEVRIDRSEPAAPMTARGCAATDSRDSDPSSQDRPSRTELNTPASRTRPTNHR